MKKYLPYLAIAVAFFLLLIFKHPQIFQYKFNQTLVRDYLRSQDIEDPNALIEDRITVSDSNLYIASGYLYASGESPAKYDFQVPPLIKYLFGFSSITFGNPYLVQIVFGLALLFLTYFLGMKITKSPVISLIATGLLLIDPVFGGMMNEALLDLGQTVFALLYTIFVIFFPESYIFQGITLGLFAASKFWSTAMIFVVLIYGYKMLIRRDKLNFKKIGLSFIIALLVFCAVYLKSFIDARGLFNIFAYEGRVLKFMLSHNSAKQIGGPIILFLTGFFAPWWQKGVLHASDWSLLWPVGLISGIILAFKKAVSRVERFFYLFPFAYLLLLSTQVPFTRYFLIILPFIYLSMASFACSLIRGKKVKRPKIL